MTAVREENGTWTSQFWYKDIYGKRKHKCKRGFGTKVDAEAFELDYSRYESTPELFAVVGFGADDAPRGFKGIPFVNRYDHEGDYSWNGNNYIDADTCRIAPRE